MGFLKFIKSLFGSKSDTPSVQEAKVEVIKVEEPVVEVTKVEEPKVESKPEQTEQKKTAK